MELYTLTAENVFNSDGLAWHSHNKWYKYGLDYQDKAGYIDKCQFDPSIVYKYATWGVQWYTWNGMDYTYSHMKHAYYKNSLPLFTAEHNYSHQIFKNNQLGRIIFSNYQDWPEPNQYELFGMKTQSINNYTPVVEWYPFTNTKITKVVSRGQIVDAWHYYPPYYDCDGDGILEVNWCNYHEDGTWGDLHSSGNMDQPPLFATMESSSNYTQTVTIPDEYYIHIEPIHWASSTQELQQGFFALNQPFGCNGTVNFVSDNQSYFASGTHILNVVEWTRSSTIIDPSYDNLRDSAIINLTCTKIGKVVDSYVVGNFEIDFDTCDLTASVLAGNFKLSKASPTSFIKLNTSCCYLDQGNISPEEITADDSSIHFGTLTNNKYVFRSSSTTLSSANVDLTLVNYAGTNLTLAATTNMSLYVGTSLLFTTSLNILVQNTVACSISMVDCEFLNIPTQIKLVAIGAGPYGLQNVIFDKNTTDPLQTWVDDIVTYQVEPAKQTEIDLTGYGIPTNKMPATTGSGTGMIKLSERILETYSYDQLFGGPASSTSTSNKAIGLKYNVEDINDLEVPKCKK